MNPVFRGLAIYFFLLIVFRLMGKKSLKETTSFDFVLLLIISEVTQQALVNARWMPMIYYKPRGFLGV